MRNDYHEQSSPESVKIKIKIKQTNKPAIICFDAMFTVQRCGLKLKADPDPWAWRVICPASAELRMTSSCKSTCYRHPLEENTGIGYDRGHHCQPCLSVPTRVVPEVAPNPQAARMNDQDRET